MTGRPPISRNHLPSHAEAEVEDPERVPADGEDPEEILPLSHAPHPGVWPRAHGARSQLWAVLRTSL